MSRITPAHGKSKYISAVALGVRRLFIVCLAAGVLCAGAGTQQKADQKSSQKDDKGDQAKGAGPASGKSEVRNNAASLLADLLGQEKNLSKILIIKHPPAEVGKLLKSISKAAGEGHDKLEALAKTDSSLDLKATNLPPGESAARTADGKSKEHELLSSSGNKFAFNVLLTQVQALDYGQNLAKVAADSSASPEQAHEFQTLGTTLNTLLQEAITQVRTLPKS